MYRGTGVPRYRDTEVPRYRGTELPRYRATEIPRYRDTDVPRYRNTEVPLMYRDTEIEEKTSVMQKCDELVKKLSLTITQK